MLLARGALAIAVAGAAVAVAAVTVATVAALQFARVATGLAALGKLVEALFVEEFLLAGGEYELVLAVLALQRAVLKVHPHPRRQPSHSRRLV